MAVEVEEILEGKVVKIAAFGAFVQLASGETGLVHISEVANTYVTDINKHLKVGDTVKVMVVSTGDGGRISLSIKRALPQPERSEHAPNRGYQNRAPREDRRPQSAPTPPPKAPLTDAEAFEERLSHFMQESKKNLAGSSLYAVKKNRRHRGG